MTNNLSQLDTNINKFIDFITKIFIFENSQRLPLNKDYSDNEVFKILKEFCIKNEINEDINFLSLNNFFIEKLKENEIFIKLAKNEEPLKDDFLMFFEENEREENILIFCNLRKFTKYGGLYKKNKEFVELCIDNKDVDLLLLLYIEKLKILKENKQRYGSEIEIYEMLENIKSCRNGNFEQKEINRLKEFIDTIESNFSNKKLKLMIDNWLKNFVQNKFWNVFSVKKENIDNLVEIDDSESMKLLKINKKKIEQYMLNNIGYDVNNKKYIENIKSELSKMCNFMKRRLKKSNCRINFLKENGEYYDIIIFAPTDENLEKNFKIITESLEQMLELIPVLSANKKEINNVNKVLINEKDLLEKTWRKVSLDIKLEKKPAVKNRYKI